MARKNLKSNRPRSSLRFRGRTPSFFGSGDDVRWMGGEALKRGHTFRQWAWRIAITFFLLSALTTLMRARLGDSVPWPASRALRIWNNTPQFAPTATTQSAPIGAAQTALALPVFVGEWMQRLDPQQIGARGLLWLLCGIIIVLGIWYVIALLGRWRAPDVLLSLLICLQVLAVAYYAISFRAPLRTLQSDFVAFDFHTHTTLSNGLLTPQQQINWHRARGFKGLAFTEADRLVPSQQMEELRRANPDMILLNGTEYHGRDGHLLCFGLAAPLRAQDAAAAIREAKKQGAFVIVAHPWSSDRSAAKWLSLGVDGVEAWNGIVGDNELAKNVAGRGKTVTGATDSGSKSGADCYVWNLLPKNVTSPADVVRALKTRRVSVARLLLPEETLAGFEARRREARGAGAVWNAARQAWSKLSPAQRTTALLQMAMLCCVWLALGTRDEKVINVPTGPTSAMSFLRRRRLVLRCCGMLLIVLAFVGSLALARLGFGGASPFWTPVSWTPASAIMGWIVLDAAYVWGKTLWRRIH